MLVVVEITNDSCYHGPPSGRYQFLPCPELPAKEMRLRVTYLKHLPTPEVRQQLTDDDWVCGDQIIDRTDCQGCDRCRGLRINARSFQPSRSQRHVDRRTRHLNVAWTSPGWTLERGTLLDRYAQSRFHRLPSRRTKSIALTSCSGFVTDVLEIRGADGALLAFSAVGRLPQGLSSHLAVWHPDHAHLSLGIASVLRELEEARRLGLAWLYLGPIVVGHSAMAYKTTFHPHEIRQPDGVWREMTADGEVIERLDLACAS